MKDDEFQNLNRLIESVRTRVNGLETDVYYLKNQSTKSPLWRCEATLSVDYEVLYRCEVSSDSYNASRDTLVCHRHLTHIPLKSGERLRVEWRDRVPTE